MARSDFAGYIQNLVFLYLVECLNVLFKQTYSKVHFQFFIRFSKSPGKY